MPVKIIKSDLYGTPIFSVQSAEPELNRVYGATYLPDRHRFIMPAFYPFAENVAYDLDQLDMELEWDLAATAWREQEKKKADYVRDRIWDPRFNFVTEPYDHQREAFAFAIHNLRSALLLQMGLGKTKIAIDVMRYDRLFNRVKTLVICPVVILYKWAEEVRLHSGGELRPVVIDGTPKRKKKLIDSDGDVYIATYGTVSSPSMMEYLIEKLDYKIFVVDESHNLQTHNSAKTQAVSYLSRKAPRRIIMSGTAALGDPRHLWGQLHTLAPFINHEKTFWKFCGRFVTFGDEQRRIVVGFKNTHILNRRLQTVSILKKKEDALDLPPRTFVTINYSVSEDQWSKYNELVSATLTELEEKLHIIEEATPAARLTKLLQITSAFLIQSNKVPRICDGCPHLHYCLAEKIKPYTPACAVFPIAPERTFFEFQENPKLEALRELLEMQLLDPTNKSIIWAKFLKELDHLEVLLTEMGITYVRVDGSVSGGDVQKNVAKFQTDPDCRVYIGQVSTGVGIDLTAANYVNFYSLTWDLGQYLQALDRAHRIGQLRNVTVYTLICARSVEEAVWGALEAKEDISAALTDPKYNGKSDFVRKLTRPELLPCASFSTPKTSKKSSPPRLPPTVSWFEE